MTVQTLKEKMNLGLLTGEEGLEREIRDGHVGDLLSYVMAHAKEGDVWVTIQGHINTVAVASLVGVSAIVLAAKSEATEEMLAKAKEEGIPVLTTPLSSFEFCKRCSQWL
ncbi:MAG: DRTGG domain-containing protein [Cellulosilyticaceae bacterium]